MYERSSFRGYSTHGFSRGIHAHLKHASSLDRSGTEISDEPWGPFSVSWFLFYCISFGLTCRCEEKGAGLDDMRRKHRRKNDPIENDKQKSKEYIANAGHPCFLLLLRVTVGFICLPGNTLVIPHTIKTILPLLEINTTERTSSP